MVRAVDTHAHLNHPRLLPKLEAVLARARQASVADIIVVGYDLPSSVLAVRLAEAHPGLWATVGVHPHDARHVDRAAMEQLRALAEHPRVVAVGETGLDFYRDLSPREAQLDAFRRHLELAEALHLPVVCHCRDAGEALLPVLAAWPHVPRVWHCFDGTAEQARNAVALGVWLGLGGTITYPESDGPRRFLTEAPMKRVLLETDAPYLAPCPGEGKRPKDNEPALLLWTAQRLAEMKGETPERAVAVTAENARHVFALRGEND
jgi:TatD DNase family protein